MSTQTVIESYNLPIEVTDDVILADHLDEITIKKIFEELSIAENYRASLTTVAEIKTHLGS